MLEKRLRDGLLIDDVRNGLSMQKAANKHRVSVSWAWRICDAAGVKSTAPHSLLKAERNEKIIAEIKAGATLQTVGTKHGITRERVRQICARAGVFSDNYNHLTPEEIALIEAQWARGIRPAHMQGFDRAISVIVNYLNTKGLREREVEFTPWSDAEIAYVKKHYGSDNLSGADIARKLGRTRNEVIGKAHRLGLKSAARAKRAKTVTINGETKTVAEWAKLAGMPRGVFNSRLYNGWKPEDAFGCPYSPYKDVEYV